VASIRSQESADLVQFFCNVIADRIGLTGVRVERSLPPVQADPSHF
jgi:hypothetical protein